MSRARSPSASSFRPTRDRTATLTSASIALPRCRPEGSALIRRLVYVAFFLEVGLLLVVLPWSGFWEHNYFVVEWPPLEPLVTNNFVRGAVTGLGLVNLYAGFADLAHDLRGARTTRDVSPTMILCLVTDRRRFVRPIPDLLDQVRLAVHAGVDLIQVRERDLEAASLADLVSSILAVTRGSRTRVVVNDRLDVAIATGADGVHLRHDSIAVAAARTLAPSPFLVGRSVHDGGEARAARERTT